MRVNRSKQPIIVVNGVCSHMLEKMKGNQGNMTKNKAEFKSIIDTIAIKNDINNFEDFTIVSNDNYDYIDRLSDSFDNSQMALKVNLHTKFGEMTLDNLKKFNCALEDSLEDIGVLQMDNVELILH